MYHTHSGLQECEEPYWFQLHDTEAGYVMHCSLERGHEGPHGYADNSAY